MRGNEFLEEPIEAREDLGFDEMCCVGEDVARAFAATSVGIPSSKTGRIENVGFG